MRLLQLTQHVRSDVLIKRSATTGAILSVVPLDNKFSDVHIQAMYFDGTYLWRADTYNSQVTCIDIEADSIVAYAPTGYGPCSIFRDGKYLWVANKASHSISKFDLSSSTVESIVHVDVAPQQLCPVGDTLWVLTTIAAGITVIDRESARIIKVLPLTSAPSMMTTDGQYVWVTSYHNSSIVKIDTKTYEMEVVQSVVKPSGICYLDKHIWVCQHDVSYVVRLDATTNRIVNTIPVEGNPNHILAVNDGVYVDYTNNSTLTKLQIIDGNVKHLNSDGISKPSAIAANEKYVWTAHNRLTMVELLLQDNDTYYVCYAVHPTTIPASLTEEITFIDNYQVVQVHHNENLVGVESTRLTYYLLQSISSIDVVNMLLQSE